jgi:hypothetical protein
MIAILESVAGSEQPASTERIQELQRTVSASRLALWHHCRLKFYFRYVLQLKKSPTPAMHAGSTVHRVLQAWNLSRWRREPFATERFRRVFELQWRALQANARIHWKGSEPADRSSSWQALEHYFTETPIGPNELPEAVEVGTHVDLSRHGLPTLVGILDLVRAGGRIVDFKLVGKSPDPETVAQLHRTQLTAYSVLYRDATGRREGGLELHHLVRTKQPKLTVTSLPPATEKQQTRLFRAIESYHQGLVRQDFVPSPGFACRGCEFLEECQKWNA